LPKSGTRAISAGQKATILASVGENTNPLWDRSQGLGANPISTEYTSVKYGKVYLNDFETVKEAYLGLKDYFEFYNHRRIHQSLEYRTPAEVYLKKILH